MQSQHLLISAFPLFRIAAQIYAIFMTNQTTLPKANVAQFCPLNLRRLISMQSVFKSGSKWRLCHSQFMNFILKSHFGDLEYSILDIFIANCDLPKIFIAQLQPITGLSLTCLSLEYQWIAGRQMTELMVSTLI